MVRGQTTRVWFAVSGPCRSVSGMLGQRGVDDSLVFVAELPTDELPGAGDQPEFWSGDVAVYGCRVEVGFVDLLDFVDRECECGAVCSADGDGVAGVEFG